MEAGMKWGGKTFLRKAGVVLLAFEDILTGGQNCLRDKGYYNQAHVSAFYSHQSLLKYCLIKN